MLGQTPRRLPAVAPHMRRDAIGIVRREKPRNPLGDRQREVDNGAASAIPNSIRRRRVSL